MAEPPRGRGLLDTSVVVAIEDVDPHHLPADVAISALTLAELTAGPHVAADELERARRQNRLQQIEAGMETIAFDPGCARAYGSVYVAASAAGRKPRGGRAVDLMIAATALAHELPLYTLNPKDFRGLEELLVLVDVSA